MSFVDMNNDMSKSFPKYPTQMTNNKTFPLPDNKTYSVNNKNNFYGRLLSVHRGTTCFFLKATLLCPEHSNKMLIGTANATKET